MTEAVTRIIGIGQPAAGDDFAGIAVVRALRADGALPEHVELHETTDPASLVDLLAGIRHAILVDALVDGGTPGTVECFTPEAFGRVARAPTSSHGIGVAEAVALARALAPDDSMPAIRIVAIRIAPSPVHVCETLSPAVAAALPEAVKRVRELLVQEMEVTSPRN